MSFISDKNCTFSEISGLITRDGETVQGAKVVRKTYWKSWQQDETTTSKDGTFHLPALFESESKLSFPAEFVVSQEIWIEHSETWVKIWDGVKRLKEENAESQGKPLVVQCELNQEDETVFWGSQIFTTKCKWDVEGEKPKDWQDMFQSEEE